MIFEGVGVSDGVVVGRVLRVHTGTQYVYRARIEEAEIDRELKRFETAVGVARRQLERIKERAEKELGKEHAYIFDAHLLMLEDEKLILDVVELVKKERCNAEWALKVVSDRLLSVYAEIKDEYLRERGSDIEDVVQRLLVGLSGERPAHQDLSEGAVIVAPDLLPSAVAELDLNHARAIATDSGGWTSHMAILARGLGIPAVVGLRTLYRVARTGDPIIVNPAKNQVILNPTAETVRHYQTSSTNRTAHVAETSTKFGPLKTIDGVAVRLRANVELTSEFDAVRHFGACGVGLYRSEFLLIRAGGMISEDEQFAAYTELAQLASEDGAIIRLFDLGAERPAEASVEAERNPALGLRAIRYGLTHERVIRTQVRAILRASVSGKLAIVLPMIADVTDVRRARQIIQEEHASLTAAGIGVGEVLVGAMIEIPSAVITADKIASEVDFFELGTNDLVQYTLAVDRGNEEVADWFRTLHPAVLFGIHRSLKAAAQAGIPAIACGEMASTPAYAVLLIGLGAVDLSMTPAALPRIRHILSQIDSSEAKDVALQSLSCGSAIEVETFVRHTFSERWPHLFKPSDLPS
jgi:phosphotransferase system enzyme I (PtsI)